MGKTTQKPIIFDFSRTMTGRPFKLGYAQDGLDCFTLIVEYLKRHGITIPETETIDGVTLRNYKDKYVSDNSTINAAEKYFIRILKEKEPCARMPGDVLLLAYNETKFFGIDAGNGNILTANTDRGVKIVPGNPYEVLRAWAIR